ncbi:hypothetical protein PP176A_0697 [Sporanaerobacter sp. PP17-6a]|nr:hypothetical protein PP176A_0697 [Sporanaerobacter sp. PP17-6a]
MLIYSLSPVYSSLLLKSSRGSAFKLFLINISEMISDTKITVRHTKTGVSGFTDTLISLEFAILSELFTQLLKAVLYSSVSMSVDFDMTKSAVLNPAKLPITDPIDIIIRIP